MKENNSKIQIISRTNKGMVREGNEDNHIYCPDLSLKEWKFFDESNIDVHSNGIVLAVADGMGGMELGEVASQIAVAKIQEYFDNSFKWPVNLNSDGITQHINKLFSSINKGILDYARAEGMKPELGTTLVMVLMKDNIAYVFWTGDSRCYLYRDGELQKLSHDHSYVQELVDQGKLNDEQAFFHPDSNIITQYLGDPRKNPVPSCHIHELVENDLLVLCSDGLNGMLQDFEIRNIIDQGENLEGTVNKLISAANEAGGHDNITVLAASIGQFSQKTALPTASSIIGIQETDKKKSGFWKIIAIGLILILAYLATAFFTHLPPFGAGSANDSLSIATDTIIQDGIDSNSTQPDTIKQVSKDENKVNNSTVVEQRFIIPAPIITVLNNIEKDINNTLKPDTINYQKLMESTGYIKTSNNCKDLASRIDNFLGQANGFATLKANLALLKTERGKLNCN